MSKSALERVRCLCLELPETSERLAWGAPTFRVGGAQKMFASFADNHHGDGRLALWCHAPKGKNEVLSAAEPARCFVPPYVGVKGWIGLIVDLHDDDELREHLREAWLMVATPTQAQALEGGQGAAP